MSTTAKPGEQAQPPLQRGAIGAGARIRKSKVTHQFEPEVFCAAIVHHLEEAEMNFEVAQQAIFDDKSLNFVRYDIYFIDLMLSGGNELCLGRPDASITPQSFALLNAEEEKIGAVLGFLDFFFKRFRNLREPLNNAVDQLIALLATEYLKDKHKRLALILARLVQMDHLSVKGEESFLSKLLDNETLINAGVAWSFFADWIRAYTDLTSEGSALELLVSVDFAKHIPDLMVKEEGEPTLEEMETVLKESGLDFLVGEAKIAVQGRALRNLEKTLLDKLREFEGIQGEEEKKPEEEREDIEAEEKEVHQHVVVHDATSEDWKPASEEQIKTILEIIKLNSTEEMSPSSRAGALLSALMQLIPASTPFAVQELRMFVSRWNECFKIIIGSNLEEQGLFFLTLQRMCFNSPDLINGFGEIAPEFYAGRVIEEDVFQTWMSLSIGDGVGFFKEQLKPFVHWLQTTPEESDGDQE